MKGMKGMIIGGIIAIFLLTVSVGAANTEIPNLEGNWTVVTNVAQTSLSDYTDAASMSIHLDRVVVETQTGQLFEGYLVISTMNNESVINEGFAGIINDDNTHAYIKQYTNGVSFADITSPDTMTLYNLFDIGPLGKENPGVSKVELVREGLE